MRFPLAPGFRRVAAAIRGHTPSSKGARLVRSTCARAASPLRNATSEDCRCAAKKNTRHKIFLTFYPWGILVLKEVLFIF